MEKYQCQAHLPGGEGVWHIGLEIVWETKEVNVNIKEAPSGIGDWPGLAVQTFGPTQEIVFRTKGIPSLFTHWWHLYRDGNGDLLGIILSTPDREGLWHTCPVKFSRIQDPPPGK